MKSVSLRTARHPNSLLFLSAMDGDDSPDIDDRTVVVWATRNCLAVGTTADESAEVSVELRMDSPTDAGGLVESTHVLETDGVLRLGTSVGEELLRVVVAEGPMAIRVLLDDSLEPTRVVFVLGVAETEPVSGRVA
jgi:hypothetical protein